MTERTYHQPVMVEEILDFFAVKPGKRFMDATLGDGGHTLAIARRGGTVLGIDQDEDALNRSYQRLEKEEPEVRARVTLVKANFRDIKTVADEAGFEKVDGILFDLGVSTYQLQTGSRGFSFMREGPLDMRMDKGETLQAADLINDLNKEELYELFTKNAEEHHSGAIADAIIRARAVKPIATTVQLAELIDKTMGLRVRSRIHPATRVFQALRIAVNRELESLKIALSHVVELLKKDGIISIITYHSGEDRIVKQFFLHENGLKRIVKKPLRPSEKEIQINRRSRSARLRLAQRL